MQLGKVLKTYFFGQDCVKVEREMGRCVKHLSCNSLIEWITVAKMTTFRRCLLEEVIFSDQRTRFSSLDACYKHCKPMKSCKQIWSPKNFLSW